MRVAGYIVICALLAAGLCTVPALAVEAAAPDASVNRQETALVNLAKENALLKEKLHLIENSPAITSEDAS